MDNFNVADIVTGACIRENEPVVGFLVRQDLNDLPLWANPNQASATPGGRFRLESLPIVGQYLGYGYIEAADPASLAVRLALEMTACADWITLQHRVTREGVQLFGRTDEPPKPAAAEYYRRTYGLAMMHRPTFDHLASLYPDYDPSKEVSEVIALWDLARTQLPQIGTLAARPRDFDRFSDEEKRFFTHHASLCEAGSLAGRRQLVDANGDDAEAPRLCSGLSRDHFGRDFLALARAKGYTSKPVYGVRDKEDYDTTEVRELLFGLARVQQLIYGMRAVGAELKPNMHIGQEDNTEAVFDLNAATLQALCRRAVSAASTGTKNSDEGYARLDSRLSALEKALAELRTQLEQTRASESVDR